MPEMFELDPADALGAGAVGEPGARAFYLQARKEAAQITVLVEKEQVALLATEAGAFLDQIEAEDPEPEVATADIAAADLREPTVPLFRARAIGIGFDPERAMVLLELREHSREDDDPETPDGDVPPDPEPAVVEDPEGWVARIYATRAQVRAMLLRGAAAVTAGRPPCPLCDQPMDPDGHRCPRWN